ncbi:MAG: hypothetical protein HP028_00175 [Clostridia bacterium]|nr:hypothetical protein [Clostridia bacterium]
MNNKEEMKKQLIVLSLILILVIIIAIVLNIGRKNNNIANSNVKQESIEQNVVQNKETEEQKILDNLKGLLEEPDQEEHLEEPKPGTVEKKITTNSGETVIVKE